MSSSSHFQQYLPLTIDSLTYGIYLVLFCQSVQVLLSRRRANYKVHLACMSVLFLLSTIHVALAYAWAFITDTGDAAIYEFASWTNPLPVLYAPGDPVSVRHIGILLKIRYSLSNAIADAIIIYRCYVIWGFNWRQFGVVLLIVSWFLTLVGALLGLFPLSKTPERVVTIVCIATVFFTNVLGAGLAAERIWWISRQANNYLGRRTQKRYLDLPAILLESGLIYPASLLVVVIVYFIPRRPTFSVLTCLAACYHIVGIAPTLIIVRVGLGVSTDDVEKCVTIGRASALPSFGVERGSETTVELDHQVSGDEFQERFRNNKVLDIRAASNIS
ncbi:hypothetical protein B0H19DRAFT_1193150 [Mycena capillaripes]|nr:hypothetical protein B0H19DRAFT_1193150 [Mycena capillaripes]